MLYDYDVIVVGGGPAGLAAAARVRWVKGYNVLVGSACVVEPGEPGGLLGWGSCVLTGPGWAYPGAELTERLMTDVRALNIPIEKDRVSSIDHDDDLFVVTLESGKTLRSHAVVLATGLRSLANASEFHLKGVRVTFKGYEHFPKLVQSCARDAAGRGLVVVGNKKSVQLRAILDAWSKGAGEVTLLTHSRLLEVIGEETVESVVIRTPTGEERVIPCGSVLMDYHGMELSPEFDISGLDIARDERGFVEVDARMRTSKPGLFAAGNITGRYSSTLMALGDGVCAGFEAYAYSFERKFARAPTLFAYAATDAELPASPKDLPDIPKRAVPIAFGEEPSWVDGQHTVSQLAALRGTSANGLVEKLHDAVQQKVVTYHVMPRKP